jgi:hypothetical protein
MTQRELITPYVIETREMDQYGLEQDYVIYERAGEYFKEDAVPCVWSLRLLNAHYENIHRDILV